MFINDMSDLINFIKEVYNVNFDLHCACTRSHWDSSR